MTKERFAEILREYKFNEYQIKILWDTRPSDNIDENRLRETAMYIAPNKDYLIQE